MSNVSLNDSALLAAYEAYYEKYMEVVPDTKSCEEAEQSGIRAAIAKYLEMTKPARATPDMVAWIRDHRNKHGSSLYDAKKAWQAEHGH